MRRRSLIVPLVSFLTSGVVPAASAVTITLNGAGTSHINSYASDDSPPGTYITALSTPTSVPASGAPLATDGTNTAETTYSLSNASFELSFDHVQAPSYLNFAGSQAYIWFSPSTNVDYSHTTGDCPPIIPMASTAYRERAS